MQGLCRAFRLLNIGIKPLPRTRQCKTIRRIESRKFNGLVALLGEQCRRNYGTFPSAAGALSRCCFNTPLFALSLLENSPIAVQLEITIPILVRFRRSTRRPGARKDITAT